MANTDLPPKASHQYSYNQETYLYKKLPNLLRPIVFTIDYIRNRSTPLWRDTPPAALVAYGPNEQAKYNRRGGYGTHGVETPTRRKKEIC